MWSGRLHDPDFVGKVLAHIEENKSHYGTSSRMKGMLTVAKEVANRDCTLSFNCRTHRYPGT